MNILHVVSSLNPNEGGLFEIVKNLAIQQNLNGKTAHILTTYSDNVYKINYKNINLKIYSFKRTFPKNIYYSNELVKFLKKNISKYNIIHIHGLYRFPTTYALYLAIKKNIPNIVSPHGSLHPTLYKQSKKNLILKRLWEFFFEFRLIQRCDTILCTSEKEKKEIKKLKFIPKKIVLPLFISNEFFNKKKINKTFSDKKNINKNFFNIVFIGRLNFIKGLDLLVPAFKKINNEFLKSKLIIIGPDNDNYVNNFLNLEIKKNNLEKKILILKPIFDKQKLIYYLTQCDLFILPSYSENFGITIFEAISQKIPTIVSDQIDMINVIKKNNLAQICKCEINSIYESIKFIIKKKRKKKLINKAFNFVLKNYNSTRIEKKIFLEYRKIITDKRLNSLK